MLADRDPRSTIYVCYRTWEPVNRWCTRMDGHASWVFAKDRDTAINRAVIEGSGCHPEDHETIAEVRQSCRIKVFEVRPPKGQPFTRPIEVPDGLHRV